MDLVFVIHASSSVGSKKFKTFVKRVARHFIVGIRFVRLAVVVFATRPKLAFGFNEALDNRRLNKLIDQRVK